MSVTTLVAALSLLLLSLPAIPGQEGRPRAADEAPRSLRVLVMTGGGYHDFANNTAILLGGLRARDPGLRFSLLRSGPGPFPPEVEAAGIGLGDAALPAHFDVVLAYTQGDLGLSAEERKGLLDFVRGGGGFVGLHSAADSHPGWEAYDRMLGGRFQTHPPHQEISVEVVSPLHEVVAGLPKEFRIKDEFYHLQRCAEDDKLLLMSGRSPGDGAVRPVSWVRDEGAGRVFYTILGHGPEAMGHPRCQELILRALVWAAEAPRPDAEGRYQLFNGRDLDGWRMSGPGGFEVVDGALEARGGMGLLWYHRRRFRDFTLSLEWMTTRPEDNSGVFVRFPTIPSSPWDAVNQGYEIQICDTGGPRSRTGCIYDFQEVEEMAALGPGKWNAYQVTVRDQEYTVVLNGKQVCSFAGERGREGFIGIQNHDDQSPVRFRRLIVKELP